MDIREEKAAMDIHSCWINLSRLKEKSLPMTGNACSIKCETTYRPGQERLKR